MFSRKSRVRRSMATRSLAYSMELEAAHLSKDLLKPYWTLCSVNAVVTNLLARKRSAFSMQEEPSSPALSPSSKFGSSGADSNRLGSGRSTTTTTETTAEGRCKLAWCTTFFALTTVFTATVSTLAVATWATTSASTSLTTFITTHHTARRSVAALLLDVGSGNDLSGQVQPFTQVVETLRGESVIVILPGELSLEVAAGGQGLASLDDLDM